MCIRDRDNGALARVEALGYNSPLPRLKGTQGIIRGSQETCEEDPDQGRQAGSQGHQIHRQARCQEGRDQAGQGEKGRRQAGCQIQAGSRQALSLIHI